MTFMKSSVHKALSGIGIQHIAANALVPRLFVIRK
jgi:hypothetical protein